MGRDRTVASGRIADTGPRCPKADVADFPKGGKADSEPDAADDLLSAHGHLQAHSSQEVVGSATERP